MTQPNIPALPVPKTSGLATASLILGCFSLIFSCLTGIPAIICAILAFRKIGKNPALGGHGMAVAGVVLGGITTVLFPLIAGLLAGLAVPAISAALDNAKMTKEVSDIRQVGIHLFAYANEHDGKYPDSLEVLTGDGGMSEEDQVKLLYKKDSTELRWILTPGLSTASPEETILLQSTETMGKGRKKGHAIYTIGNVARWLPETENSKP
jgi:hypothetical protein